MVAVCPATEPARLFASSPAIGHACSLTRSHVEAADGAGALCPCAASLECCLSFAARSIPARCHLGIARHQPSYSERLFFARRTPRACHGACDHLRPPQAPRQSRGLLAFFDARTRLLRSKRRSGHRMRLDNRKNFGREFGHARRLLRHSDGSIRILLRESALHSTSLASELQSERSNG